MQNRLPETVNFLRQVEKNACYEGAWPLARLERLSQVISDTSGVVTARLRFGTSAGTRCLDGVVKADLELRCERCLEPVKKHIESGFRFGLVISEEEAESLPKEFEPLVITDTVQSLIDLVEDELLLSLPIVARHDEECSDILLKHKNDGVAQNETYRPFAALKDLMS